MDHKITFLTVKSLFDIINNKRHQKQEDWLILVVSDHGGDGTSHYDSSNPDINQTIFSVFNVQILWWNI